MWVYPKLRLDALRHKQHKVLSLHLSSSPLIIPSRSNPFLQWLQPSQHTLQLSLSLHPSLRPPLAPNNVASRSRHQLQNARCPPSSSGMTQVYPCPPLPKSGAARSVVSPAPHRPRKRPARSGPWKKHRCSSRAAIAYVFPSSLSSPTQSAVVG